MYRHYELSVGEEKTVQVKVVKGDLCLEKVDAIVNPANSHLKHVGGTAAAISYAGGFDIDSESDKIVRKKGKIKPGECVHTTAGKLPCKVVLHVVGPMWYGGKDDEEKVLHKAVTSVLKLAEQLEDIHSVSIPPISTGIFRFPKKKAVDIILTAIENYFKKVKDTSLTEIRCTSIDKETTDLFILDFDERYKTQDQQKEVEERIAKKKALIKKKKEEAKKKRLAKLKAEQEALEKQEDQKEEEPKTVQQEESNEGTTQ